MRGRNSNRGTSEPRRGMIAPLAAVCMIPLIGILALSIDGGMLMSRRRHVQAAADAAALAAAGSVYKDLSGGGSANYTKAQSVAQGIATANGYSAAIQFNQPPTSGTYANQAGYIEVVIAYHQPSFFGGIYGTGTVAVQGLAVAQGLSNPYSKAAILVLGASGTTVALSGSTKVTASGGSVVVDSTSASSITSSGAPRSRRRSSTSRGTSPTRGPIRTRRRRRNSPRPPHPTPWRISRPRPRRA